MNLNLKKLAALFVAVTVLMTGCSERVPPATNQSAQRVEAAKVQQQLITYNQDLYQRTAPARRLEQASKRELLASAERCWSADLVRRDRR